MDVRAFMQQVSRAPQSHDASPHAMLAQEGAPFRILSAWNNWRILCRHRKRENARSGGSKLLCSSQCRVETYVTNVAACSLDKHERLNSLLLGWPPVCYPLTVLSTSIMASAMAFPQMRPLPGLNASLEKSDLGKASGVYNKAATMDDFPASITGDILERLGEIFVQHGAHLAFALGLIHSHDRLSTDEILVNESLQMPGGGSWMRTAKIEAIDTTAIRGQSFKINEVGNLVAYKFCYGPLPKLDFNLAAFVEDLTTHINELGLGNYLCLQLREDTPLNGVDFDLGEVGTVLIPKAAAKYGCLGIWD
ncbi:hypothetical protein BST61_g2129 [Cercospora zeina]